MDPGAGIAGPRRLPGQSVGLGIAAEELRRDRQASDQPRWLRFEVLKERMVKMLSTQIDVDAAEDVVVVFVAVQPLPGPGQVLDLGHFAAGSLSSNRVQIAFSSLT